MTLTALRDDIAAGRVPDGGEPVYVDGALDHVRVAVSPTAPEELGFGDFRRLPARRRQPACVIFPATVPAEGSRGVTVLAELTDDGLVHMVLFRLDDLR